MADLVGDEEGLLERRADVLVHDEVVLGHECGSSVVEDRGSRVRRVDVEAPVLGYGDGEDVGIRRIEPARHGGGVQVCSASASELDRVHASVAVG